jgi:hypothetical protein
MPDNLTILLQLLLDKSAKQQTEQGITDITKALVDMDIEGIERATEGLAKLSQAQEKVTQAFERSKKEAEALRKLSDDIGKGSTKLIAAGSAVIGGMYLAANSEAKRIKEAGGVVDATTQRWLASQDKLQKSYQSIGRSAMTALVPALEQAASLAEKAAKFAESNPDLVKGLATAAGIAISIGALGKLISGGLRVFADAKYIFAHTEYATATLMFQKSVKEYLAGVVAQAAASKAGGGMLFAPAQKVASSAATTGMIAGISTATITVIVGSVLSVLGGVLAGVGIYDLIAGYVRSQGGKMDSAGVEWNKFTTLIEYKSKILVESIKNGGQVSDETAKKIWEESKANKKLADTAGEVTDALENMIPEDALRGATQASIDYQKAETETDKRYGEEKLSIETSYAQREQELYQSHAQAMQGISMQLSATLSEIEQEYQNQLATIEANYQEERASIVKQGNDQVAQIQKDAQERLQELATQHAERVENLTNSRDALALAQENRDYAKQRAEEEQNAKEQIAQAKQQTKEQLAELDRRHQMELQAAQQQYEQQKAAAEKAAQDQMIAENQSYQEQLAELEKTKADELKQLEAAHAEEHAKNLQAFNEQLNQLGIYLGDEYQLRQDYFSAMLEQTRQWLESQKALFSEQTPEETADGTTPPPAPGPNSPTHDSGGYANAGLIRIGKGQREFVLSDRTRRAAEASIGGRLTQENIMASLLRGSGGAAQNISVNVGDGMTLMQVKRTLQENNRSLVRDLSDAIKAIG